MKSVVYIGNRPKIIEAIDTDPNYELTHVFALEGTGRFQVESADVTVFNIDDFSLINQFLINEEYEMCVSGGCPFVLPVTTYSKDKIFINSHPSLLPYGKGIHPINEIFLSGRSIHGSTVHFLTEDLDAGDIISQKSFEVTEELDLQLMYSFIFEFEKDVVKDALSKLSRSETVIVKKQCGAGTYYSRKPGDGHLLPATHTVEQFLTKIKAFSSCSGSAVMQFRGDLIQVRHAEKIMCRELFNYLPAMQIGEVVKLKNTNYLCVKLTDGTLVIKSWKLQ